MDSGSAAFGQSHHDVNWEASQRRRVFIRSGAAPVAIPNQSRLQALQAKMSVSLTS
jgi:hypothetical protein